MDIITTAELASYLRDDTVTSEAADLIVEMANGLVSAALGDPEQGSTVAVRTRAITFEVAARAWRNPEGYSSETIDDYTYRRDAETRRAGVYLTDSEATELGALSGSRKAFVGWLA